MPLNVNLAGNVSTYEARLNVARTLLGPKINQLAAEKHIFFANQETDIPATIADSPLVRSLSFDYNTNTLSGLAVMKTQGGMGKTVAARLLLHYASRGIMFHGGERGDSYWRNVAVSLGLPEDMPPKDKAWTQVLVETVAYGYEDTEELTFVEKMIRGCCNADTTAPEPPAPPVPLVLPDGVAFNTVQDPRAVIIFDDFNRKSQEDLEFFFSIYRVARAIEGVYCLVTTQNANIANALIDESAWVKLNPLHGTFTSAVNPLRDQVPNDTGHFEHPNWNVTWTRDELRLLIMSRYDERMLQLVSIEDGFTPSALLLLCKQNIVQWRALPALQHN